MTCGYEGAHFGASYPDARCIDGFLWDLDSDDNGYLTHGGDMPCPQCDLAGWLLMLVDDFSTSLDTNITFDNQPWHKMRAQILALRRFHSLDTIAEMLGKTPIAIPYWCQDDDFDDFPTHDIYWPFPLDDTPLSAHEKLTLLEQASPPKTCYLVNNCWIRPTLG